jgi:hypothetical protein
MDIKHQLEIQQIPALKRMLNRFSFYYRFYLPGVPDCAMKIACRSAFGI